MSSLLCVVVAAQIQLASAKKSLRSKIENLIVSYEKYKNELKNLTPFPRIKYIAGALLYMTNPPLSFAEGYKASPANITLGVNEKVTIRVGNVDLETGNFSPTIDWFFFADRFLTFSAEILNGNPSGAWFIHFDPPTVSQKFVRILATNATISLSAPTLANELIQSTIIRIKIADTWVVKNVWWPENHSYWWGQPNYNTSRDPLLWFLGALATGGYGGLSGKITTEYYNVDVLVKVKPYHAAKIQALPADTIAPSETTSIPVMIENQGNYNDTFNFRIRTETGYPLRLANNGTITLGPGQQGTAYVGVAAPSNVLDTGTLHSIILEIFSADDPNTTIASQRLFVNTQGIFVSEQISAYSVGAGFCILIILIVILVRRRRMYQQISITPEKPWKIPEEQAHLAGLKRTDFKTYEQERIMMENEYASALLWYSEYKKIERKKLKEMNRHHSNNKKVR